MVEFDFLNLKQALADIETAKKKAEDAVKVARQMGIIATNAIKQNCNVKSGTWQGSWQSKVNDLGGGKAELVVFSPGAFAASGYNYGARQEALYHPGAIGWQQSEQAMKDLWNQAIHGVASSTVTSGFDQFGNMGGF